MRLRSLLLVFISIALIGSLASAFEIQFPGETGFYIGKPMLYVITDTAGDPNSIGQEGIYTFGPNKIVLDGAEYYDCSFITNGSGGSHFYLGIDSANSALMQKSIIFGDTELDITPAIVTLKYPLAIGKKWDNKNTKTKLIAKNLVIPGLGKLPGDLSVDNVVAQTTVSSQTIKVPAGSFDTLLVETTYTGSPLGIPMTLIQRTWMSEDNVPVKRSFEFTKPTNMMIYAMELSESNPDPYDLNWDGIVNVLDLMIIAKSYGQHIQYVRIPNPDIDGNGVVDMNDMEFLIAHFGKVYKK